MKAIVKKIIVWLAANECLPANVAVWSIWILQLRHA